MRGAFGSWRGGSGRGGRLAGDGDLGFRFTIDGRENEDLAAAFEGELETVVEDRLHALELAYHGAMTRTVDAAKARLRADVVSGGFHRAAALSKTWRGTVYPKLPRGLDVAGWIWTKAQVLIDAFEQGVTIRAVDAQFLALPAPPAKAILRRLQSAKRRSSRNSGIGRDAFGRYTKDDNPVAQVASALGVELEPRISRDGRNGVLVAPGTTLTRGGRASNGRDRSETVLFYLVRSATLKKRLRGRALLAQIAADFPAAFVRELAAEPALEDRR